MSSFFSLLFPHPPPITEYGYIYLILKADTFILFSGSPECFGIIARIMLRLYCLHVIGELHSSKKMPYSDVK